MPPRNRPDQMPSRSGSFHRSVTIITTMGRDDSYENFYDISILKLCNDTLYVLLDNSQRIANFSEVMYFSALHS
jgi:hypothetical protein